LLEIDLKILLRKTGARLNLRLYYLRLCILTLALSAEFLLEINLKILLKNTVAILNLVKLILMSTYQ
jgi:hypothetical protein